jgi:hypothetical protein
LDKPLVFEELYIMEYTPSNGLLSRKNETSSPVINPVISAESIQRHPHGIQAHQHDEDLPEVQHEGIFSYTFCI